MQGNLWKRICIEHFKELGSCLFARENNCATSQTGEFPVEGGHRSGGRRVGLLGAKDGGIGFLLLMQYQRLFEARSEDAVIRHRAQQNEHVVSDQRIRPEHQYLALSTVPAPSINTNCR